MIQYEGNFAAASGKYALIVSRWNSFITDRLLEGAIDAFKRHGIADNAIVIVRCPGAYEIPLTTKWVIEKECPDAVVALGAVIRGSTPHFDYVCNAVNKGIADLNTSTGVPVIFGVLTTDNIEQAVERAGTKAGNKGAEAALAAIEMVSLKRQLAV